MTKKTIAERLQEARKLPAYWIEKLTLDVTSKLWAAMKQRELTQAALAQKVGKQAPYVNRVLNGNHNVTLSTLVSLAHALDMEVKIDLVEKDQFSQILVADSVNASSPVGFANPVQPKLRVVRNQTYLLADNNDTWALLAA